MSSSSSCLVVPTVGNISQDLVVVSPDPVQIFCFTAGYPRPTIMWFLNGQPVTANENVTIDTIVSPLEDTTLGLGLVTGILRLNVTHPSDAGVYECVSSNLLGSATNTTNMTVHRECMCTGVNVHCYSFNGHCYMHCHYHDEKWPPIRML